MSDSQEQSYTRSKYVSIPQENLSVENVTSWEGAIRKAKRKISSLRATLKYFEESKKNGEPWPGQG
jgi:PIN domain nuclease of toxin-antitoxin system